jgi:hypothetical protein
MCDFLKVGDIENKEKGIKSFLIIYSQRKIK